MILALILATISVTPAYTNVNRAGGSKIMTNIEQWVPALELEIEERSSRPQDYTTTNAVKSIADGRITKKVAEWAMKGKPQPAGSITNILVNGASVVNGGIARVSVPSTNGLASAASVRTAKAEAIAAASADATAKANAAESAAKSAAKAYTDEKISNIKSDRIATTSGLSTIHADGAWVTRTNATEGVAVTNALCTVAAAQAMTNDATLVRYKGGSLKHGDTSVTADDVWALPATKFAGEYWLPSENIKINAMSRIYFGNDIGDHYIAKGVQFSSTDIFMTSSRHETASPVAQIADLPTPETEAFANAFAAKQDALPYPTNAIPASAISGLPTPDYTTNNTTLVSTITNLAPSKARGISLHDPDRNCNWYQAVTNGVFYWIVEED